MFTVLRNERLKKKRIKKDELLAAVCILIASREAHIQFSYNDIASSCENVSGTEIGRKFKLYERELCKGTERFLDLDRIRFIGMLDRFTSGLDVDFFARKKMRRLYRKINEHQELATLNPLTRLSCAIYMIMGKTKDNCREVSRACNVSEHTIIRSTDLVLTIIPQ